jgi:aryl-alcohol dehydrogenase-like predicted oxidoreductase
VLLIGWDEAQLLSAGLLVSNDDYQLSYQLIIAFRPENLRRSVDYINEKLGGTKRVDLYECARIDPKVSVEETIKTLVELVKENKFDHIGLSEVSAETLRRANAVSCCHFTRLKSLV